MGPYERRSGAMSVEQRGPAVCRFSGNQEGKDEMTKASTNLQDLRRRIYVKAKAETTWRFWGLYVHVCKMETLSEAYALAKNNTYNAHMCHYRPGGRKYRRTGAKSASFRFPRS